MNSKQRDPDQPAPFGSILFAQTYLSQLFKKITVIYHCCGETLSFFLNDKHKAQVCRDKSRLMDKFSGLTQNCKRWLVGVETKRQRAQGLPGVGSAIPVYQAR